MENIDEINQDDFVTLKNLHMGHNNYQQMKKKTLGKVMGKFNDKYIVSFVTSSGVFERHQLTKTKKEDEDGS